MHQHPYEAAWLLLLQARRSAHHLMRAARRTSPPWRRSPVGWGPASLGPRHDRPDLVFACGPCTAVRLLRLRRSQAGGVRTQVGFAGARHQQCKPRASRQMIRTPPCVQVRTRVQSRAAHAMEAHVRLRVWACGNAQNAFSSSGVECDALIGINTVLLLVSAALHCPTVDYGPVDGVLYVPATVSSIPNVSERALTSSSVRRYACGVHPCLLVPSGRPALPLPQTLYSLGRQRSVRRSNAPSSYIEASWDLSTSIYSTGHARACAHSTCDACMYACTHMH